jgi:hypothetical protein
MAILFMFLSHLRYRLQGCREERSVDSGDFIVGSSARITNSSALSVRVPERDPESFEWISP